MAAVVTNHHTMLAQTPIDTDAISLTRTMLQTMRQAVRDDSPRASEEFCLPARFARTLEAMDNGQTDEFCRSISGAPLLSMNEPKLKRLLEAVRSNCEPEGFNPAVREWERRLVSLQIALIAHIVQAIRIDPYAAREHWGIGAELAKALEQLNAAEAMELGEAAGGTSLFQCRATAAVQVGIDLTFSGLTHKSVGQLVALNQLCTRQGVTA